MKQTMICNMIALAFAAAASVPVEKTVDVSAKIKPLYLESYAGETLDLSVQLMSGGRDLATPAASATIYWQTNGMANAWWQTNMACSAEGLVTGSWSPGLPSGRVWFFVGVESSGLNYRVSGQCSVLPSPGGAPSTAVLPPPGGTLNLGDYTIVGAPWITSSDSAAAIASATAPLASEIAVLSERADSAASSGSNYTDSVAAPLIAATNSITARLDGIVIPDVSGFADKTSLQAASNSLAIAVQHSSNALAQATSALAQTVADNAQQSSSDLVSATNALHTSLAPTISTAATALQPSASNALAQATAALAQTVADNAQQAGYDLAAASNALAQATAALSQTVADNAQEAGYDLAAASNALAQATAALSQTVADNAQQSSSDLISATNALHMSLAPTISAAATALQPSASNALAQATAALAQTVAGIKMAQAVSNAATRLILPSGDAYMDATGVVWQAYATNRWSQWHVLEWQPDHDTPPVATNELPSVADWAITWEARESAGIEGWNWVLKAPAGGTALGWAYAPEGGEAATNIYVLIGGDDPQTYPAWRFGRTNEIVRGYAPAYSMATEDFVTNALGIAIALNQPGDYANVSNAAMKALSVKEAVAGFTDWKCVPSIGTDRIAYDEYGRGWGVYRGSEIISDFKAAGEDATNLTFSASEWYGGFQFTARRVRVRPAEKASLSTNDVCAIVTNEVPTYTEWTVEPSTYTIEYRVSEWGSGWVPMKNGDSWGIPKGDETSTNLTWAAGEAAEAITATRNMNGNLNGLGLARLIDLSSACSAMSNYTDAAIAAASAAQAATWSRPGDWVATATPRSVPVTAQNVNYVTNNTTATITSNIVETVYYSLSADLDVEELDELSPVDAATASALGVTFEPTNGGVVTGNVFYATAAGLYRIRATSATRGSRYADCPLTAWQQVSSNAAVYIADAELPGKWRKGVNDAFLSDLNVSVHAATGVVDGASYDVWWTLRCPCRPISGHTVQGYRSRNALSPHLLIGARHYGYNGNASWLTFHDPVGNTNVAANTGGLATGATAYDDVTVPADYGFPLCMWALKHGWTRAELEAMNISDIAVYPIKDGATLPDPCIPYFASLETLRTRFGGKGNIGGWAFSQTYVGRTGPDGIAAGNYMTPAIINIGNLDTATYGACTWTCAGYSWGSAVRADILARWRTMREVEGGAGSFPPIYGGDSSGGIYFKDADGRWIMVSMFTTIGSGPSLSAAVPVLRALCAEYGDTLKEVE